MTVNRIHLKNYRNYEELKLDFCKGLNIFYGENAQGKTNLLEAIYYCGTTRSFRGVLDRDLVLENEQELLAFVDNFCRVKKLFREDIQVDISLAK